MPAARFSLTLRSSSANRYGGIFSRRLLGLLQLLDEVVGEPAAENRHRPAAQVDLQVLSHFHLELAAVAYVVSGGQAPVTVILDGGELTVEIGADLNINLSGWAVPVFRGTLADEFIKELHAIE